MGTEKTNINCATATDHGVQFGLIVSTLSYYPFDTNSISAATTIHLITSFDTNKNTFIFPKTKFLSNLPVVGVHKIYWIKSYIIMQIYKQIQFKNSIKANLNL